MTLLRPAPRALPDWTLETQCGGRVAGVDEVGRGPAAGPVVAAAVVLDPARAPAGINDSKKLSAAKREALFGALLEVADFGVGLAEPEEIDRVNLANAAFAAMARAVSALKRPPDHALIDGDRAPRLECGATAVVKGDARAVSIAAASIIAKVTRDRLMAEADAVWPAYGFARHVGYLTAEHRAALEAHGPCPIHRRAFAPVREASTRRARR